MTWQIQVEVDVLATGTEVLTIKDKGGYTFKPHIRTGDQSNLQFTKK